jgi:hypothetical protein
MTNCTKYKVIYLHQADIIGAQTLEDWLNEQCEEGLELIAINDRMFIFKRNAYIMSIKKVEDKE